MAENVFEDVGIAEMSPSTPSVSPDASVTSSDRTTDLGAASGMAAENAVGGSIPCPEPAEAEKSESEPPAEEPVDYGAVMREDLATLKASFPELAGLGDISELSGALRYAALRDMGLSAVEAYMASSAPRTRRDNRSHLSSAVKRGAAAPSGSMTHGELSAARELFSGMSDAEIHSLYKRVTG